MTGIPPESNFPDGAVHIDPSGSATFEGSREHAYREKGREAGAKAKRWVERFLDGHLRSGTRDWSVACHLLPLTAYAAPIPGLSALLAWGVWCMKRDGEPGVASHGREALNFHINVSVISLLLIPAFPLWPVFQAAAIFLAIKAALRAAAGETWRYPLIRRPVE
jgi:uncharacterized Tic20 family protein